jgi:hypothetical protein
VRVSHGISNPGWRMESSSRPPPRGRPYHKGGLKPAAAALGAVLLLARFSAARAEEADAPPAKPPAVTWNVQAIVAALAPTAGPEISSAEFWYGAFSASFVRDGFGARAEVRGTPGGFRPYYGTDIWLEEGYAFMATPAGDLFAGKRSRPFGLRDETFEGNLFSWNGVSRAPDWGAGVAGEARVGYNTVTWGARWVGQGDGTSYELAGRGAASEPGTVVKNGGEARATYLIYKGIVTVTPGVSFSSVEVVRPPGLASFRMTDVEADLTAALGPIAVMGQVFSRNGNAAVAAASGRLAYDDGLAWLAGIRAEFPTVAFRYFYSHWSYQGLDETETLQQPAVVWMPRKGIEATIEYRVHRLPRSLGGGNENAFRLGLALSF